MTPVIKEPVLGYHPCDARFLTSCREPAGGQCQAGSLTGAVASERVSEALKGSLRCSSRGTRIRTRTSGFGDRYSTIKLYPYITIVINLKYHVPSKLHIIKHSAF